ncbi:MAG: HAD family phosphatase [Bacteroidaceae bacterium]|nr:HAD family phosphatase [Bacteroidaceae bacterium]
MNYRMIVLDLDGTLTNSKKEITPYTRETLIRAQQQGIKVVLASGRPTYGIAPIANQLELFTYGGYILAYNGGEIIDWKSKEVLHAQVLDPQVLPYMYRCAQENGFAIVTYRDNFVITETPDDEYVQKEATLNLMQTLKVENFLGYIDFSIPKCLIVGEAERLCLLEKQMYEQLKETNEVYRSEPYFLELVPKGIDKAQSLEVLLRKVGISRDEVIACGDGFNDLSMIRYAGLGVAMHNAQPVVREAADFITLSNDEDGVAHVVEQFMLKRD